MASLIWRSEKGQILPLVLVSLVIGSILIVPSMRYVSTHVNAGNNMTEHVKGVYGADAGMEDAIWRSVNDPDMVSWALDLNRPQPYKYTLPATLNGMTVDVTVEKVSEIQGVLVGDMSVHSEKVGIVKTAAWDPTLGGGVGGYHYTLSLTCNDISATGKSPYTVYSIAVQTAPGLAYAAGSSILTPPADLPVVGTIPTVTSGPYNTLLVFQFPNPLTKVLYLQTAVFTFDLLGPSGIALASVEGFTAVKIKRNDVGTITDAWTPLRYTVTATSNRGLQATIVAEIWTGNSLANTYVRYWHVNPR